MTDSKILKLGEQRANALGLDSPEAVFKLLDSAVEVFQGDGQAFKQDWSPDMPAQNRRHRALLIGITPIVKESPERALLRELVKSDSEAIGGKRLAAADRYRIAIERARALLNTELAVE